MSSTSSTTRSPPSNRPRHRLHSPPRTQHAPRCSTNQVSDGTSPLLTPHAFSSGGGQPSLSASTSSRPSPAGSSRSSQPAHASRPTQHQNAVASSSRARMSTPSSSRPRSTLSRSSLAPTTKSDPIVLSDSSDDQTPPPQDQIRARPRFQTQSQSQPRSNSTTKSKPRPIPKASQPSSSQTVIGMGSSEIERRPFKFTADGAIDVSDARSLSVLEIAR